MISHKFSISSYLFAKVLIFTLLFVSLHPTLEIIKMEYGKIGKKVNYLEPVNP